MFVVTGVTITKSTAVLCSGLFQYYHYFNVISYVRKPRSHTCIQGQVSVDLSMCGAFCGRRSWVEMAPW